MATREQLLAVFDMMEAERQQLLQRLQHYSEETLNQKPTPTTWSVTETIYHLKIAEQGALGYLRKKLEVGGHQKVWWSAGMKQRLLNWAVMLPVKYKAPAIVQVPEGVEVTYHQAVREWDEVRKALRKEYENVDESGIDHALFKHPMAGKLSIMQSVRFMRQHVIRHVGQIDRILKKVS